MQLFFISISTELLKVLGHFAGRILTRFGLVCKCQESLEETQRCLAVTELLVSSERISDGYLLTNARLVRKLHGSICFRFK